MRRKKRASLPPESKTTRRSLQVPDLNMAPSFRRFYIDICHLLRQSDINFLLGGAHALASYTGIARQTKDVDLFINPRKFRYAMNVLKQAGYTTETKPEHWLGKVRKQEYVVDIIFSSGNGLCNVDQEWFQYAYPGELNGHLVNLIPPEEMLWTKSFVMERHRYDGADIIHLIHAWGRELDWARLLRRFESYWEVLFSHLTLYAFVYPGEIEKVPARIWNGLLERLSNKLQQSPPLSQPRICYGALLSGEQYIVPIQSWKYLDARLNPIGSMNENDITQKTDTMKKDSLAHRQ